MKYLKIPGWDKWQTFRNDRATPPWIKLHRNLFSNPEWIQLTDQEKGQLVSMWIAAADKKGKISSDPDFIRKMCLLDSPPNLQRFKDLGFLDGTLPTEEDDSMTTTSQPQTENVTKQSRVEESRVEEKRVKPLRPGKPDPNSETWRLHFENLWKDYPEKKGKHEAWIRFKKQVTTVEALFNITRALKNYKTDMERIKIDHPTRAWLHGSTWFNHRWSDFVNYRPPAQAEPKTSFEKKRNVVDRWAETREAKPDECKPIQNRAKGFLESGRS